MELTNYNNKIIILKDSEKDNFVSNFTSLINYKIITLSELKKKYYFDYTNESIYYISKKYNVIYDIAKIYIDNLYYINKDINEDKVLFLKNIKNDLDNNNLLEYNPLFKKFLTNKNIILYNLKYIDKFYINIFNELKKNNNIEEINYESNIIKKDIYKSSNYEDEISFICSSICELINNGIDINKIKLANVNEEYYYIIKKTFKLFNIPINLKNNSTIKGTLIIKKFKELFRNDIDDTLNNIKPYIKTNKDEEIYNSIINIINSYSWSNNIIDVKDFIFKDIDNIKIKNKLLKNAIEVIDIKDYPINDDYIFLINFNEGVIPINHKDEDYLNDKIKSSLDLSTSYELNILETSSIKDKILSLKNLIITYSNHNTKGEIYISPLYNSEYFNIKEIHNNYNYSNNYNKLKLVSEKDENRKFGTITEDLILLNNHYNKEKYLSFDNRYKQINKDKLYNYLNNSLTLSYSSMDTYYKCGFRYYLDNILKINKYEETFSITIGNIFHHILCIAFNDGFDFEVEWNKEISNYTFNTMESFFINKLKKELVLIIDTIKNQLNYTQLTNSMYEKEIIIEINPSLHIRFKGFVDKILYKDNICVIIDYKTGNPSLNINNSIYGLNLQLPVYIYLIKNSNIIKDVKIGGFYLQKILNTSLDINERINNLKLQGYSNSDLDILEQVDSSYASSKIIKSLKYNNDKFYAYSKVLSSDEMDKLSQIVENKIKEASSNIIDASFNINPKQIGKDLIGCEYCKYKDICYMKHKDIINLKEIKDIFSSEEGV